MEYQLSHGDIQDQTGQLPLSGCDENICPAGSYSLELDFPEMISIGLAYKPSKDLTWSLDIKQISWSDTLNVMKISGPDGMTLNMPAGWEDQTIISLGVNYDVTEKFTIRAGYNQSDAPISNADTDSNYILPAVTSSHYALGGDYRLSKFWELGFHVSKALDETITSQYTGAKIGLGITTFGVNIGYRF